MKKLHKLVETFYGQRLTTQENNNGTNKNDIQVQQITAIKRAQYKESCPIGKFLAFEVYLNILS